ncbi:hypothetical protein E4U21_007354 [Claviceps maximensis]|nr:hypothetical protein E4U21_007354 [Claviceps maximensis]
MRFTSVALLLAGTMSSVFAVPSAASERLLQPRAGDSGMNNGYYYSSWADYDAFIYSNGPGGRFDVSWKDGGNVVVGKGWNLGGSSSVSYSGTWWSDGNSFLSIYGWSKYPLVEFYIVENYGTYNPSQAGQKLGELTVDGSIYDIYVSSRAYSPSILSSSSNFQQYWSIRRNKRVGGTVSAAVHLNAWWSLGLPLGTVEYMIVAVEGNHSSGSASITVY